MPNSVIEATKRAAHRYSLDSVKIFFMGIDRPGWWRLFGAPARARVNHNLRTVEAFNAKLEDCHSCIAPEEYVDFSEPEKVATAIIHFEELAAECQGYADALSAILKKNLESEAH